MPADGSIPLPQLQPTDTFRCELFRCTLRVGVCVQRQLARIGFRHGNAEPKPQFPSCAACQQGQGIRARLAPEHQGEVKVTPIGISHSGDVVASKYPSKENGMETAKKPAGERLCAGGCGRRLRISTAGERHDTCFRCRLAAGKVPRRASKASAETAPELSRDQQLDEIRAEALGIAIVDKRVLEEHARTRRQLDGLMAVLTVPLALDVAIGIAEGLPAPEIVKERLTLLIDERNAANGRALQAEESARGCGAMIERLTSERDAARQSYVTAEELLQQDRPLRAVLTELLDTGIGMPQWHPTPETVRDAIELLQRERDAAVAEAEHLRSAASAGEKPCIHVAPADLDSAELAPYVEEAQRRVAQAEPLLKLLRA